VSKAPIWPMEFPIEPRLAANAERLAKALARIASEDMRFGYSKDPQGAPIAKVVEELHIDALIDNLKRTHKVEVNIGAPQVAYRETLARTTEIDYTHKKQTGGTGQFARVKLRLEPNEPGTGNEFLSEIVGGVVPKEYIPGVEKGVQCMWDSGVFSGFPLVDAKVTLFNTRWIRARSPSRSQRALPCAKARPRPASNCLSRSWTWKWYHPAILSAV
jgi:elongation factor G